MYAVFPIWRRKHVCRIDTLLLIDTLVWMADIRGWDVEMVHKLIL
jgi:hypothetical protein